MTANPTVSTDLARVITRECESWNELFDNMKQQRDVLQVRVEEAERELGNARMTLGLVVLAAGGTIRVPNRLIEEIQDISISRREDIATGETVYAAKTIERPELARRATRAQPRITEAPTVKRQ